MSWTCMLSFGFISLMASKEKIFEFFFFENIPFMLPWQPFRFSNLDKIHMNRRGLLKKNLCRKKNLNICSETAKIATFYFSHYKSMETISCHSNQSSYSIGTTKKKNTLIRSPPHIDVICEIWKESASRLQSRSRLKMLTDDGRTDGGCLPIL